MWSVPGSPTWPATLQPLALVTSPRLGLRHAERRREYYMGEGGGFPRVRAMVSLVSPELLVACPSTKGVLESELTNLLVGLM
jgi:hypothetical protein